MKTRKAHAMQRKIIPALMTPVGDDEVDIVMSTADLARDGHILEPMGCVLDNYRRNPIQLWQHDPEHPVGTNNSIVVTNDTITARCKFAPLGISAKADEVRGLVKSDVIRAVSVGFDPIDSTPLDPKKPRGGQRIHKWELMECSFVSVPADPGAVVSARAEGKAKEKDMTVKNAKRAALADFKRFFGASAKRGLYDVSQLAYMLYSMGNAAQCAQFEAAIEGDESEVPGMLVEIAKSLGEALVAMAEEESAELIEELTEGDEDEADVEIIGDGERAFIDAAPGKRSKAFRRALVMLRAGKSISQSTADALGDASDAHGRALKHHKALGDHQEAMRDGMETMSACVGNMREAMTVATRGLDAIAAKPEDATSHAERAAKAIAKAVGHADKHDTAAGKMKDSAEDATDSHAALGRSIKAAQRSVDAVLRSAATTDSDPKEIQKPEGDTEDEGSRGDADYRRRQADKLALAAH